MGDTKHFTVDKQFLQPYLPDKSSIEPRVRDIINKPSMGITDKEICGPSQYVKLAHMNKGNTELVEGCLPCSNLKNIISRPLEHYITKGTRPKVLSTNPTPGDPNSNDKKNNLNVWESLRSPEELARMCHPSPDIYVPAQYNANPYKVYRNIRWTEIVPVSTHHDKDLYKKWFDDRNKLQDKDIDDLYNYHKRSKDLPSDITSPQEFRKAISTGRGSSVKCSGNPPTTNKINFSGDELIMMKKKVPKMCPSKIAGSRYFGPENILFDEYNEWRHENDRKKKPTPKAGDFSMFYGTFESNRRFEDCMNKSFSSRLTSYDLNQISEIKSKTHFRELTNENILYIKQKMNLFLIDSNKELIVDCVKKDLYFDVSICNAGLSEQILKIVQTLFYIVGYDFRNNKIESEADKKKLIHIIDQLGDRVPRVLESILDVSERYEASECNGITTNNTRILRELHTQVFKGGKNVFSFDLGLSKLTGPQTTNEEFSRTTILGVLVIAFLKYF